MLAILPVGSAWSQTNSVSPYSRFGPGEVQFYGLGQNQQMGGLMTPMIDSLHVNPNNPASYAHLRMTSFEVGAIHNYTLIETETLSETNNSTNLNHIAIGLPLGEKFGAGFTIYPYTTLGYNLSAKDEIDSIGGVNYFYNGTGGVNIFTSGLAYMPIKGLSIGVNLNYIFGRQDRVNAVEFDSTGYFNTQDQNTLRVSNFYLTYGIQYKASLKNGKYLTAGLYLGPEQELEVQSDFVSFSYSGSILGNVFIKDTLESIDEVIVSIVYRAVGSFGVGFGK